VKVLRKLENLEVASFVANISGLINHKIQKSNLQNHSVRLWLTHTETAFDSDLL